MKNIFFKSSKGFTLIEILIGIAIIGILSAVAIPQYNKYKIRGYDAHSKQALRDMHTLCNAYWLDNDSSDECELSLIKNITYGFNQNPEIVATLPPSPLDNFCASAKHNSSPNTYSIDSASLISDNEDCGVALAAELADKAEAERIAAEEKKAEQKAAYIEQAKREDCCIERIWKAFEGVASRMRRMDLSGCLQVDNNWNGNPTPSLCRAYMRSEGVDSNGRPEPTGCPAIRLKWFRNDTKFRNTHVSEFGLYNPDHPCARKF
jgi:prepilin-type N-terminal cleavage/methylation domain-containing protein